MSMGTYIHWSASNVILNEAYTISPGRVLKSLLPVRHQLLAVNWLAHLQLCGKSHPIHAGVQCRHYNMTLITITLLIALMPTPFAHLHNLLFMWYFSQQIQSLLTKYKNVLSGAKTCTFCMVYKICKLIAIFHKDIRKKGL